MQQTTNEPCHSSSSSLSNQRRNSPKKTHRRPSNTNEERVQVYVRVKPHTDDTATETAGALEYTTESQITLYRQETCAVRRRDYAVDKVFTPAATQSEVFDTAIHPLVQNGVLNGYSAVVMAYGATGAGKTHTMANMDPDAVGMIPRAALALLSAAQKEPSNWSISMSFLQIYLEKVQDLLSSSNSSNLALREDSNGETFVENLTRVPIQNLEDCLALLTAGNRARACSSTNLNEQSSRSHAVVIFDVLKKQDLGSGVHHVQTSRLFMVDLAGSERVKKSGSVGEQATEARSINLSLTTLGKCIAARASGSTTGIAAKHIPFRESKLTRLLQGALSGTAKACILVNVCDAVERVEETAQSLAFGCQAMHVTINAQVNSRVEYGGSMDGSGCTSQFNNHKAALLEQTLLSRESALKDLQDELAREQAQSNKVIEVLRAEREAAEEAAKKELELVAQKAAAAAHEKENLRCALEDKTNVIEELTTKMHLLDHQHAIEKAALVAQCDAATKSLSKANHRINQLECELAEAQRENTSTITRLNDQHAHTVRELKKEAAERLQQVQNTAALNAEALQEAEEELEKRIVHVEKLQELVSFLEVTLETEQASVVGLKHENEQLKEALVEEQQRAVTVVADFERRLQGHYKLSQALLEQRRRHNAARVIQRHYRKLISSRIGEELVNTKLALDNAQTKKQGALVISGQGLVGDSIKALENGASALLTTFLVPNKDLKTINKYSQSTQGGVVMTGARNVNSNSNKVDIDRRLSSLTIKEESNEKLRDSISAFRPAELPRPGQTNDYNSY